MATKKTPYPTTFHEVLHSDLPPEDKANRRMADEAQTVVGAGIETVAWAMSIGVFHIVNSPHIYNRLYEELSTAIPDPYELPNALGFEKLPYLRACITGSVRFSYAISARNPRVFSRPLQYKEWIIRPRTPTSTTSVDVHHDEHILPDCHSYIERWLGNPKAPNGSPLDRYFVGFGKG